MDISKLDEFTRGYLDCALWSGTHSEDGTPLDDDYSLDDLSPEAVASAVEDCKDFQEANRADLDAYKEHRAINPSDGTSLEYAGHDFSLTRNGHGVGFWDRGLGELGDRLTEASRPYGSADLYPGDDGLLYFA